MKKAAILFLILSVTCVNAAEMNTDQILDRAFHALGGKQKLEALSTRVSIGKVEVAGLNGTYELRMKSPNRMRLDLDLGVLKQSRGFDGKVGWTKQAGVTEQQGADLQRTQRSAIFLPILHYADAKVPVRLKGKESLNGSDAYVLEFSPGEKSVEQFYIDTKTFLLVREVREAPNRQGSSDQITTDYSDYRDVNGVKFPFSITQTQPGQVLAVLFDQIRTNVPLAEELFQNPVEKFSGEPFDVNLVTIPHHIYKENDGVWEIGPFESFYFSVLIREKHSRPLNPVLATMKFYSGKTLVKSIEYSDSALNALHATSFGGFANQEEVFDLTYSFSEPVKSAIDRLVYRLEVQAEDGTKISKEVEIPVEEYSQKVKLNFPIKGKFIVAGAHDFNEPHSSEWSQHYAYDIVGLGDNYDFSRNNGKANADFFGWGMEILAPADGIVVYARNDVPENQKPGVIDNKVFMSRPDPMWAVGGNDVVIDHGNGEFSLLAHMQQGSVKVKKGDQVKQGDVIGLLGNTGNSDAPHLHYHLMACETIFRCDGLPSRFENVYDAFTGEKLKAPFTKRGLFLEAK